MSTEAPTEKMLCGVGKAASGSPVCANAMRKEKPRIQKGGELTEKGEREANEVKHETARMHSPRKGHRWECWPRSPHGPSEARF